MPPSGSESAAGPPAGRVVPRLRRARLTRPLRALELACLGAGTLLLLAFAAAHVDRGLYALAQAAGATAGTAPGAVDQSLWSEGRIAKYREALQSVFPPPLAVLHIPRLGLEVPVLEGIDDRTLNRAVGHIPGTAAPGEVGNVAIAGHRDGFFRGLKDLAVGDRLELETGGERRLYAVESLRVVEPEEVEVLEPTPAPVLTLVTCYPFYFVGNAPQRYIVRAAELPPAATGKPAGTSEGR